ncbi:hypothetical protein C2R46_02070 [Helicobacter pylori]|nr:hypothetical protein C2R46_02070 [Helicobacter pylori]
MKFPYNPKIPHDPLRARYEKLFTCLHKLFILIVKILKGINLITNTLLKTFIGFIKCVGMS